MKARIVNRSELGDSLLARDYIPDTEGTKKELEQAKVQQKAANTKVRNLSSKLKEQQDQERQLIADGRLITDKEIDDAHDT